MGGRKGGSYAQAERLFALLERLSARRTAIALDELAEAIGVSVKQLRRDLAALSSVGYEHDLERVDGRSAVRLRRGRTGSVTLSLRERYALLAMRDVLAPLEGTPLAEDADAIFRKIAATLPDDAARELAALGPRFRYIADGGIKSYAKHADVVDALFTGALRRRRVDARYRPASGRALRGVFEPWGLALYRHGLYAVGPWGGHEGARVFAVERFQRAELKRGDAFDIPTDFTLDAFFAGAFGVFPGGDAAEVIVDFNESVATVVRARTFHPSQRLQRRGRGIRLRLEVPITPDLVSWLVGWGPHANVIAPSALAARVVAEHRAAIGPEEGGSRGGVVSRR